MSTLRLGSLSAVVSAAAVLAAPVTSPASPSSFPEQTIRLELPVIDIPYNGAVGYDPPSMQQSLALAKDFTEITDEAIDWAFSHVSRRSLRYALEIPAALGFQLLTFVFPLTEGWEHEEWHRAVMAYRGVTSTDETYRFPVLSSTYISHVTDEALSEMKAKYPRDFIRSQEAGMEGQLELSIAIQKDNFFDGRVSVPDVIELWTMRASVIIYLNSCASHASDQYKRNANAREGADIMRRDFTGCDFTGWMYDLERPFEPYDARGVHPSGVGIDRYRSYGDLSPDGQKFLRKARNLSLLDFVAPQLFGVRSFPIPFTERTGQWNVSLVHELTSFGQVISGAVFLSWGVLQGAVIYHHYFNEAGGWPGIQVELVRYPLPFLAPWSTRPFLIGADWMIWAQPTLWTDRSGSLGGKIRARLDVPVVDRFDLFIDAGAKTDGWVAGDLYLGRRIEARLGLALTLGASPTPTR